MKNTEKVPFDINVAMERIREAVKPFPKAAMFQLADEGFITPFEQLVGCIISIRTLDETTIPLAQRFFSRARTPEQVSQMMPEEIETLIEQSSFHERKAVQIQAMAIRVVEEYGGTLPCDPEALMSFSGVGLKCANLVLGIACGKPRVSVDVHVFRITNRWGYMKTSSPEETSLELEAKLPEKYWVEINRLLVPFGKHICTGRVPLCSTCPVLEMCQQVGVGSRR